MAMNRRITELGMVLLLYVLVYVSFIGPAIGAVTGFDTPAITSNGIAGDFSFSVRTVIVLITGAIVMYGYANLRARMVGVEPSEYWNQ